MKETTFSTTTPNYKSLITNLNYNFAESPSTQQYHSVAARDNPDYAQAIGDIYRWGDVNRANFNLNLDYITDLNNKQYLDAIQKDQRAYAEKLRNEQRAYNERQQAKAWAKADARSKELRDQQLNDQKYQLALKLLDRQQQNPRDIANFTPYRTNNTNIDLDLNALKDERQNLIDVGNKLFAPENLTGSSPNEMLYNAIMAEKQHQQDIKDYEAKASQIRSNYQEDLLRQAANASYLTSGQDFNNNISNRAKNVLMNNDDRSVAAKMISETPFFGLTHQSKRAKAETLQDFMYDYNALDTGGWNSDDYNKILAQNLQQNGYDISKMSPLISYDSQGNATDYVFDAENGTIFEVGEDDNTKALVLVPIKNTENLHSFSLDRLFNIGRDLGITAPRQIKAQRPKNFGE